MGGCASTNQREDVDKRDTADELTALQTNRSTFAITFHWQRPPVRRLMRVYSVSGRLINIFGTLREVYRDIGS